MIGKFVREMQFITDIETSQCVRLTLKQNKPAEECRVPPAIPTNILAADSKVVSVIPAHGLDYLTV